MSRIKLTDAELMKLIRENANTEIAVDPITPCKFNGESTVEVFLFWDELKQFLEAFLEVHSE